ncbi:MAG: iron hydrogenase small subunit [Pilosibacter sp.]|nr:iron hydrogenase small subunit [butyrate-producing bacterium]
MSRDKNKNPAITRVFETYLGEPCGEKSHNQQFISDPLF